MDKIYRSIAVLLMMAVFFAQTFSNAIVAGSYYCNTAAYAKNCENKDKPWLHCNGKCQMRKQQQQENKKDQENPEHRGNQKNQAPFFTVGPFNLTGYSGAWLNAQIFTTPRCIGCSVDRSGAIFHPPQV